MRRAIAGAGAIVLALFLIFGVRACLDARLASATKDYLREVGGLLRESDQQSENLFSMLGNPGDQGPVELQTGVNGLRVQAEQLAERARALEPPDELAAGQAHLVEVFSLRRDGVAGIAVALPSALGDQGRREATERIAVEMRELLAADVIYAERFRPAVRMMLREEDLTGELSVPESSFLPEIDWLRARTVADRLGAARDPDRQEDVAPGLHGTELGAVTVQPSGQVLTAGSPADIPLTETRAFEVEVTNGGENDERDVVVTLAITGAGAPLEREARIDELPAGETDTVTIQLADTPAQSRPVTLKVQVEPVPGEENTDNNTASFEAVFGP